LAFLLLLVSTFVTPYHPRTSVFAVGECILLCMYQISKYRQPSFANVLQRAPLYTYITTCFG
jgi:uncharacterized membrane protein YdcZ (DUF606 family)